MATKGVETQAGEEEEAGGTTGGEGAEDGGGAQFGITSYPGRGNGEGEPWGDGNGALTTQGRERAREQKLHAQRTANKNLRTRVEMLEVTLRGCIC